MVEVHRVASATIDARCVEASLAPKRQLLLITCKDCAHLKTANPASQQEQSETDDPGPHCNRTRNGYNAKSRRQGNHIKHQRYYPNNHCGSLSGITHDCAPVICGWREQFTPHRAAGLSPLRRPATRIQRCVKPPAAHRNWFKRNTSPRSAWRQSAANALS